MIPPREKISPVGLWILLCAVCNWLGWNLSTFHALNRAGYAISFAILAVVAFAFRQRLGLQFSFSCEISKWRRRFTRFFPAGFLLLSVLAFLGGALHGPGNYDGLAYRTPRVLHWLADSQWHWIHTDFVRMNNRAVGYEWLTAPLFALTGSDRLQFLINTVSLALMPGLLFSLFTRLGVRRHVAYSWMWLLPTGYCFLLQAGGIANDLFGVVFALAAVDLALRARANQSARELWLSILAVALLTGSKASNIPLALPWLLAALPALGLLRKNFLATAFVVVAALLCSYAPIALTNIQQCGDWSGQKLEGAASGDRPLVRLGVNTILLAHENFAPPIFPLARAHNAWMAAHLPESWTRVVGATFEGSAARLELGELAVEEQAGLGFGVSVLLAFALVVGIWHPRRQRQPCFQIRERSWLHLAILLSPWIGLLVFMLKSGLSGFPRLAAPYYLMCAPALLGFGSQVGVVRRCWWRWLGGANFALAALLLIVCPSRPLWPALTILRAAGGAESNKPLVRRMWTVYSIYSQRWDALAPARGILPAEANPLGMVTFDDPETSLWRPFGSRRIEHVTTQDTRESVRARHIRFALVSTDNFSVRFKRPFEQWLADMNGTVRKTIPLRMRAGREALDWHLVEFGE